MVAAAGGEVRFAGTAGSSGLTVSVRTADGRFDTSYLHLATAAVREGDRVDAGAQIGTVGMSGTRSVPKPHLHFGVRDAGSRHAYHDPLGLLPPPPASPQAPRETPAPQPAPAPARPAPPAPAPVNAPAGHRVPEAAPGPRRVPVGAPSPRRVPVGAPNLRRVPVGAPGPTRVPVGAPGPTRAPVGAPGPTRVPVGAPNLRRVPVGAPSPPRVPVSPPDRRPAPDGAPRARPIALEGRPARPTLSARRPGPTAARPAGRPEPSRGPDLGLLLACLGLVAAAALLGLSQDGRKATRSTRTRIARALEPILGRR